MSNEFAFIDWIRSQQRTEASVLLAAGDDLAIVKFDPNDLVLIGIDQILDGVHFNLNEHDPRLIGKKAMNRNLSDCAAMACLPVSAVVSFAIPRGMSVECMKEIYLGMKEAGEAFDCHIVGGDTGSWDQKLAISVAITGKSAGLTPVRRSGARVGDTIYVTGALGGSILGRHLIFTPRVREARDLVARHAIRSMIDLSDGLSRDLGHICRESGVGAVLDSGCIPIHDDARQRPGDVLLHALNDGEDHELCFTADAGIDSAIRIGKIVEEKGVWIDRSGVREKLITAGFEHHF